MAKKKATKKKAAKKKAARAPAPRKRTKKKAPKPKAKPVHRVHQPDGKVKEARVVASADDIEKAKTESRAEKDARTNREKAERKAEEAKRLERQRKQQERAARRAANNATEQKPATVTPIESARAATEKREPIPADLLDRLREEKETFETMSAARLAAAQRPFREELQDLQQRINDHLKQLPKSSALNSAQRRYEDVVNEAIAMAESKNPALSASRVEDEDGVVVCKPEPQRRGKKFAIPG